MMTPKRPKGFSVLSWLFDPPWMHSRWGQGVAAAVGLLTIAWRVEHVVFARDPIDIAALLCAIIFVVVALLNLFRGNVKSTLVFHVLSSALGIFAFVRLDAPPLYAREVAYVLDHRRDANAVDHETAARYRVAASGYSDILSYINWPPREIIKRGACDELLKGYSASVVKEPLLARTFARPVGACADVVRHDEALAATLYLEDTTGVVPGSGSPMIAARNAAVDGLYNLSLRLLDSEERAQPQSRTIICGNVAKAFHQHVPGPQMDAYRSVPLNEVLDEFHCAPQSHTASMRDARVYVLPLGPNHRTTGQATVRRIVKWLLTPVA